METQRSRPSAWLAAIAILLIPAGPQAPVAAADSAATRPVLVLLDGKSIAVDSLQLAEGKLSGKGVPASLTLDDLRRIVLPGSSPAAGAPAAVALDLVGGGKLLGTAAVIFDDQCALDWPLAGRVLLPIDAVRALRFGAAPMSAEFDQAFRAPGPDQDRIFLREADKTISVVGLVESLSEKQVAFEMENLARTQPRANLVGIVLAQAAAADPPPPASITLRDGSAVGGELLSLTADKLACKLPGGATLELPTKAVLSIALRSSRMVFLADLKPIEVVEQAVVTLPRPWQKNRSTLGRALTLGKRVYESGIGVHARSELTFAVERKYDVLAGVIGIDAETLGRGDCVFVVRGDGESLFTQRMKGTDEPKAIQVDIRGRSQVTLVVEPGADLDLADHANWCDIRFIKNAK